LRGCRGSLLSRNGRGRMRACWQNIYHLDKELLVKTLLARAYS
jgi:hypothetical protein